MKREKVMSFSLKRPGRMMTIPATAALLSVLAPAQTQNTAQPAVKLDVLVLDQKMRPLTGLRQEDFRITEEGKPQAVTFFSKEEKPLSYGLVIDSSGSLRSQMDKVIRAAITIINGNKPEDEAFVVSFVSTDYIVTMQEFTRNKSELAGALSLLQIRKGQTALIDAIYTSADYLNKHKADDARRALILVTDGEERNSFYTADALFKYLRATGIQIFTIGLVRELNKDNGGFIRKSSREMAEELLERLAQETGGRTFYPKDDKDLQSAADEIMLSLRSEYVIGYLSNNPAKSKQYRKVTVTVESTDDTAKRKVIARPGYVSP
jgi:Ca-activated chloride channel family protein